MMPARLGLVGLKHHQRWICRQCLAQYRLQVRSNNASAVAAFSTSAATNRRTTAATSRRSTDAKSRQDRASQVFENLRERDDSHLTEKRDGYSINWFEQSEHGQRQVPNEEALDDKVSDLRGEEDVDDMMEEFGHHFKTPEERRAFADAMRETSIDWGLINENPEEADKAEKKLDAYRDSIDREIETLSADLPRDLREEIEAEMGPMLEQLEMEDDQAPLQRSRAAYPQVPETEWTPNQRKKVARLNTVIRKTYQDLKRKGQITNKGISNLYKAYHAARLALVHSWDSMPLEVWDFLWHVLSADRSINTNRYSHVTLLSRDMSEAQVELTPTQQLLTIEAVFAEGWEPRALDNWRRCVRTLGDPTAETFKAFWELGLRILCQVGDLEQAENALDRLIGQGCDPRAAKPLIRSHCEPGEEARPQKAWDLYRSMRDRLGPEMKLADYDEIISYFLATHQTEHALHVFVDMMSEGEIDMSRHKTLPSVVANKFFLGKWLKRLIGAGDLDGAWDVVEYMRMRGVSAAPIHLNGLIGAWYRKGSAEDHDKAAALAWKMIDARLDFVKARREAQTTSIVSSRSPAPTTASLPRATLETFSVLAESYRSKGFHQQLLDLWDKFRAADMSADAFMMNQLLESYIHEGQWLRANEFYQDMVKGKGIVPDPYTFSALWKTLSVNRLHPQSINDISREITVTRTLFAEMTRHSMAFRGQMDGQLARKVLHTFRRLGDHAGLVIALRTLKDHFHYLPPDTLVLEMVMDTSRLSWESATQRRRLLLAKRDIDRELIAWAQSHTSEQTGQDRGVALYEYLQKRYWAAIEPANDKDVAASTAAKQMGVYELLGLEKADL